MPFPPGDMVAAFSRHMHFKLLEQALCERHPELADRVRFDEASVPTSLKVMLSEQRSVVLTQVRMGPFVWAVVGPVPNSQPYVWPLSTPDEVLVDALYALASAHLADEPVASPWCWSESEPSELTELADLLKTRSHRVRRVAAGNGYFAHGPRHAPKLDVVGGRDGGFVEAEFRDAVVRASLRPALGWLVDAHLPEHGTWGRVDLALGLWRGTRPTPGVPRARASAADIADLLDKGPKAWEVKVPFEPARREQPDSTGRRSEWQESLFADVPAATAWLEDIDVGPGRPAEDSVPAAVPSSPDPRLVTGAVLGQLTAFGFGDLEEGDDERPIRSDTFHIEWHTRAKNLSTSEMQRLNGLAAAAGEDVPKRLIVITTSGISRPAAAFADTAKAFVFFADRAAQELMALNSRAQETSLPRTNPAERVLEPW